MRRLCPLVLLLAVLCTPGLARAMSCAADSFLELARAAGLYGPSQDLDRPQGELLAGMAPPALAAFSAPFSVVPLRLILGEAQVLAASLDMATQEADLGQLFMRNSDNPALALQSMKSETARQLRILLSALARMG